MKFLDLRSLNAQKRHFKFLPYLIEIGGNGQKLKIAIWTSKTSKIGKIRPLYLVNRGDIRYGRNLKWRFWAFKDLKSKNFI